MKEASEVLCLMHSGSCLQLHHWPLRCLTCLPLAGDAMYKFSCFLSASTPAMPCCHTF